MISNQSTAGFRGKMWVVMRDPQSNTDTKVSKGVEAVGWRRVLLFARKKSVEACTLTSLQQTPELAGLWGCGSVGSAVALALATVLARVFAAALALAVILAFAGVLGRVGGWVILSNKHAGV